MRYEKGEKSNTEAFLFLNAILENRHYFPFKFVYINVT